MIFIKNIFAQLQDAGKRDVLVEAHGDGNRKISGSALLDQVAAAREYLRAAGLAPGDRCALIAPNSIRWAALDLAIMAEGLTAVPLYARQAPGELAGMLRDAQPSLVCCADAALRDAVAAAWTSTDLPRLVTFDDVFSAGSAAAGRATADSGAPVTMAPPVTSATNTPVAILYTSGTSGEPKGVILTGGNLNYMVACTGGHLDQLMGGRNVPDRVFHYLPFCFAGSWILLLSCLSRPSVLTLSMDLAKLADEMRGAAPNFFLNVPTLLERIRAGVEENIHKRGGVVAKIFRRASAAWRRVDAKAPKSWDLFWLGLAGTVIFPSIRKRIGPNLRALICGSAPLARDTQLFFLMLGIPVLQVYGLTETTAICTMDDLKHIEPGCVGSAIAGIDMKAGENGEILVRGPNIFAGYWNRPEQTAEVLRDGWFYTGDQGNVNEHGNWSITGRLKNLIILNSGHNIAPEPIEEDLVRTLRGSRQVVLLGNGRSYLTAIIVGEMPSAQIQSQMAQWNATLPHYRKIRMFHVQREPFTIENGLLTANGKLKRDAIAAHYAADIGRMYDSSGPGTA